MGLSLNKLGVIAILAVSTALIYANSLQNPFIVDDQHIIVRNLLLRQWTLADIMRSHFFAPLGVETQYYRPLTLLTFAINYTLFELNPTGYHIFNLAAHLSVVVILYSLFSRFAPPWVAAFSAALFAAHPANVQAVTYISSRSDPLYAIFTLLSLLFWNRAAEKTGAVRAAFRSSSVLCFFIGLFAKESAIISLPLVVLTDLIRSEPSKWRHGLAWKWYLFFGAALALYIGLRVGLAGYSLTMEGSREAWRAGDPWQLWPRILLAIKLVSQYLLLAIYPVNLSFFRDVATPQGLLDFGVIAGGASLVILIALATLFFRSQKEVCYGILWFLIAILPVLNLTSLNAPMMEHWLYLALAGLALAIAGAVWALKAFLGGTRGATLGLCLVLILLSAKTVSRNAQWGDPIALFSNDARLHPRQEKNWFLLGYAYYEAGRPGEAIKAYRTGLDINPLHAYGWSGLGEALSLAGHDQEAEKSFLQAINIMPENPWLHYALGIQKLKTGNVSEAIEALEHAAALKPAIPLVYHLLGSAFLRSGKSDEAEQAFNKALLLLSPDDGIHSAVHLELAKLYRNKGENEVAEEEQLLARRFRSKSHETSSIPRVDKK